MNWLLVLIPLGITSAEVPWPAGFTFVLCLLPLCSLAERLGFITEQLACYTNDTIGGLLNASFGNAPELIIAAFALKKGLLRMVQLTLLGSIVSNLLLVMGSAFIAGGLRFPLQKFNLQGVNVNCCLLVLSVVAISLPSLVSETHSMNDKGHGSELGLSRFESLAMVTCYCFYLFFQLSTHRFLFEKQGSTDKEDMSSSRKVSEIVSTTSRGRPSSLARPVSRGHIYEVEMSNNSNNSNNRQMVASRDSEMQKRYQEAAENGTLFVIEDAEAEARQSLMNSASQKQATYEEEDDEEEEEPVLSLCGCFLWLTLVTIFVSLLSDYITECITAASKDLHIPMPFLTTIMVPIVGNAAEHASAVLCAYRNKIEISLGVAVGSATQIGALVVPFCVLLGWCMAQPLDLNFNGFEAATLFVSVFLGVVVLQDGYGNWLKGVVLVISYFFVAAGFWVHEDQDLTAHID